MHATSRAPRARLRSRGPLLLDGALGTELERRGVASSLPLWSTHALLTRPELVRTIHREYVEAGADIVTANTFRTQARTLARAGIASRAAELTARAVGLAREVIERATEPGRVLVAGSAPPLEDCYRPDLVPEAAELSREHAAHAEHLAAAGVDLILCETLNCVREAVAAVRAARATGLPVFVSFVCAGDAQLLSGEPLAQAIRSVAALAPDAVLVNCLPLARVAACLPVLRGSGLPFGAYANLGAPAEPGGTGWESDSPPVAFAEAAAGWIAAGARIVGGCCGTRPDHIRAIATRLRP